MYVVKVIKKNNRPGAKKLIAVLNGADLERHDRRAVAGIVNDWISQCRETSRVDRILSNHKISAWLILPPTLTETLV